ncbi:hypothetical protein BH11BAC4_BH11BAC4_17590 [soil metagenome]
MSNAAIKNFIDDHGLKRADGCIIFNAVAGFYDEGNVLCSINTEIQIVHVAGMPVLYIIDTAAENFHLPDMYTTHEFHFAYSNGIELEIRKDQRHRRFFISVRPVR